MELSHDELERKLGRCRQALRQAGVKATHQRIEIYREVAQSAGHPDVETVYAGVRRRIPTVSLDTVYRTLWLFNDIGLVGTLSPHRDRVRFDANTQPHHHFVCRNCGLTCDIHSPECDNLQPPAAVFTLGLVESKHVEFRGLCAHCQQQS